MRTTKLNSNELPTARQTLRDPEDRSGGAREALAAVRANIERDFEALLQKEPRVIRLALNEAEALAWESGFPALIFPTLAAEKASKVAQWHERQTAIRDSRASLAFAA